MHQLYPMFFHIVFHIYGILNRGHAHKRSEFAGGKLVSDNLRHFSAASWIRVSHAKGVTRNTTWVAGCPAEVWRMWPFSGLLRDVHHFRRDVWLMAPEEMGVS